MPIAEAPRYPIDDPHGRRPLRWERGKECRPDEKRRVADRRQEAEAEHVVMRRLTVSALSAHCQRRRRVWWHGREARIRSARRIGCTGLVNLAARLSKTGVEKRIGVWEGDF